jgi:hypothetical protein
MGDGRLYMKLHILPYDFSVCKVLSVSDRILSLDFFFICHTDEEVSLVCRTEDVPENTTDREDGWRVMRFEGVLDFSLVGILSKVSNVLAEEKISIFATSTYNTDYVLVKGNDLERAVKALEGAGYEVE